jgi:hypothetical protein
VDVRHVPGKINIIADGLSCQWEGQELQEGDSDSWTMNPDRDKMVGLANDILLTHNAGTSQQINALKEQL